MKLFLTRSLILAAVFALESAHSQNPKEKKRSGPKILKPKIEDTIQANIYADNWFQLYINGVLVATDSITFIPHNVVSTEILPEYPMTIAVVARDNADPETGLEYNHSNIGDGGFILKFGDGTVTNATWKAKVFSRGPLQGDITNPKTEHTPLPQGWHAPDFDDSSWPTATVHSPETVKPKQPYYEHDFKGAQWIWSSDLALDNVILFRTTIAAPPNGNTPPMAFPRGTVDAAIQTHHQK